MRNSSARDNFNCSARPNGCARPAAAWLWNSIFR